MLSNTKVFYHKNCNDGMGAAVALYNKVPNGTTFSPLQYGEEIIFGNENMLIFIDYTPTADEIEVILSKLREDGKVIILDHHLTAIHNVKEYLSRNEDVDPRLMFYITQSMSGAMLGYHVRRPSTFTLGKEVTITDEVFSNLDIDSVLDPYAIVGNMYHEFYTLLDVRDRWIEDDPELKREADDLSAFLYDTGWANKPVSEVRELVDKITPNDFKDMITYGGILNKAKQNQAKSIVSKSFKPENIKDTKDKEIKLALTFTDSNISDAGSLWSNMNEGPSLFVGIMTIPEEEKIVLSVRSNKLASAKNFCEVLGGGGHLQAAGCSSKELFNKSPKEIIDTIIETISNNEIAM